MELNDLIAPEVYNLTSEIDRYDSDKIALRWEGETGEKRSVTYHELIEKGKRFANVLTGLGIKKGDRVMMMVPKIIDTYVIYLGALRAGIAVIPGSEMLHAGDIAFRINQGGAKAIIAYRDYIDQIEQVKEPMPSLQYKISVESTADGWLSMDKLMAGASADFTTVATRRDDIAFLTYTSGTAGTPKGVVHDHGWAYAHLRIAPRRWLNIHEDDIVWATAGPGWQMWIWSPFLSVLGMGVTGIVYEGRFHPAKQLELLQDYKVNVLLCTPTEYRLMAKVDHLGSYDLSHLHTACSAGEALNSGAIDTFKKTFGLELKDGYGQTESTLLIGTTVDTELRLGSMGQPLFDDVITIVDEDGHPVPDGVIGNIAVRRDFPALLKTYYHQPDRYQAAVIGDYFLTGDRASRDKDNYFWFHGRRDDVIISSGFTIGPAEVEDALLKHPAVKDCAVVASPHPVRGNIVKAFVVLKESYAGSNSLARKLKVFVKNETSPYKYPREIEFVADLPKSVSGKIKRADLRDLEISRARKKGIKV
ncbi:MULTISPECIES: acyl-CoA synthetase MbcS [unclassified Sporolactobacillus]|uniref:acyl-CoA synthetase MbcS n=1 Tax=unclassified Sporolactobacillus TaxID=2628533 RepID=UPI002368E5D4|nr:AMP-binding protein [Sporolactobacillus sp. CQH2019]MDD9148746.1 AMP-binding protein [Sporolactobacillus sp. CQH2019]